jgi:hypothetical protein
MKIATNTSSSDKPIQNLTSDLSFNELLTRSEKEVKQHMRTFVTGTLEAFLEAAFGNSETTPKSRRNGTRNEEQ